MPLLCEPRPDTAELLALLEGRTEPSRESEIYDWIEHDPETLAELTRISGSDWIKEEFDPNSSSLPERKSSFDYRACLSSSDREGAIGSLGRFSVLSEIGRGGMSVVLKAVDESLDRVVALKWLNDHMLESDSGLERFRREATAVARIEHPNVLPVYSTEVIHDRPVLVTRYVEGVTLESKLLDTGGGIPAEEAIYIATGVAKALEAAHGVGLIHRDVKPSNIMLEPKENGDHVWLMDFGLVKLQTELDLTREGTLVGTPHYMSPEQAGGENVGVQTDIYSLGVVLYRMLTGKVPFYADHLSSLMWQISERPAPKIRESSGEAPVWLESFVAKTLEKDPATRPQSAAEVVTILETRAWEADTAERRRLLTRWGYAIVSAVITLAIGLWLLSRSDGDLSADSGLPPPIDPLERAEPVLQPMISDSSVELRIAPDEENVRRFDLTTEPAFRIVEGGSVTLENMELRARVEGRNHTPVFHNLGGRLRLENCKIILEGEIFTNEFSHHETPMILVENGGQVEISDCVFHGPKRQVFYVKGQSTSDSAKIEVDRSVFFANCGFAVGMGPEPMQALIEARNSFFACNYGISIMRASEPFPEGAVYVPRTTVTWDSNHFDSYKALILQDYPLEGKLITHFDWYLKGNQFHQPGPLFDAKNVSIPGPRTMFELHELSHSKSPLSIASRHPVLSGPVTLQRFEKAWNAYRMARQRSRSLRKMPF